jgi:hypothetical protein
MYEIKGVHMNDEWTRENQIKKTTLKNQLLGPYLTAVSIFSGLTIFILSTTSDNKRYVLLGITLIALLFIAISYHLQSKKIDQIFEN